MGGSLTPTGLCVSAGTLLGLCEELLGPGAAGLSAGAQGTTASDGTSWGVRVTRLPFPDPPGLLLPPAPPPPCFLPLSAPVLGPDGVRNFPGRHSQTLLTPPGRPRGRDRTLPKWDGVLTAAWASTPERVHECIPAPGVGGTGAGGGGRLVSKEPTQGPSSLSEPRRKGGPDAARLWSSPRASSRCGALQILITHSQGALSRLRGMARGRQDGRGRRRQHRLPSTIAGTQRSGGCRHPSV